MLSDEIQAREQVCLIDGLRVFVREVGEGSPVLLINGIGAHTGMWAPIEQALTGFRLIEFDAPGTGRSQTPRLPRSIPSMADLAAGVLEAVEVQQADVIGYSLGGIVSQELAASAPERVRRLVLAATTCGLGAVPGDPAAMLNLATPLRYWSHTFYSRTLGGMAGGKARNNPEFVARHGEERMRHKPSMQGYTAQMIGAATWSTLPSLPRITAPTLIVMGDDDPLVPPANGALLSEWISESRLLIAPGEGHLMLMDPDSAVMQPIRTFLGARNLKSTAIWRDTEVPPQLAWPRDWLVRG